jgi:CheY-like chemotaxis protein
MAAHKLLLADDSATIRRVVELTFAGEDVDVVSVGDGEEAIARIPTERPHVILADIAMPKRSGYDVAAFVKGHPDLKHIPVLLLAGAFEPVDEARAEEVGCDGVLVKPFEPQQVIARVRELLDAATPGRKPLPPPAVLRPVAHPPAPARPLEFPRREDARSAPPAAAFEHTHHLDFVPEPSSELEEAPPQAQWSVPGDESLDDYFDRLDAAFTNLEPAAPLPVRPSRETDIDDDTLQVPLLDDLVGAPVPGPVAPPPVEPPDITATRAPGMGSGPMHGTTQDTASPRETSARSVMAEAFTALLALEEGEPGAKPVRLTSIGPEPIVTDALVEEVTRRVIERLAPGAVREVVAQVVSDIAERLVREEIARVRNRS